MVEIRQNLVSADKYDLKCPYTMEPQYVVIHNTANDASAANEIAYMRSNSKEVSFHYAVDDKEIVQGIPENRNAWHAGDGGSGKGNRYGIGVEICWSKSGGEKFTAAEKNAAEFAAHLLKKYGWGIDRLKKHRDFNGKYCPHRTLDLGWERFVKMVQAHLAQAKDEQPTETEKETAAKAVNYKAKVTAKDGLRVRKGAGVKYGVVKVLAQGTLVTVTAEQDGWGRISDGWISLEWVEKVKETTGAVYVAGKVYTTKVDALSVRKKAGTNYVRKTYKQLTADAKKHAYPSGHLKKGTSVTCLETKNVGSDIWIRIPSGWCAAYYGGSWYIK